MASMRTHSPALQSCEKMAFATDTCCDARTCRESDEEGSVHDLRSSMVWPPDSDDFSPFYPFQPVGSLIKSIKSLVQSSINQPAAEHSKSARCRRDLTRRQSVGWAEQQRP